MDCFTRWPEAIPLNYITSATCAQALISHWIACFGIPMDLSSDRGTQFTSQLWTSIAQLFGIQLHHTTAYHPQSNGLVEMFHRHLKASLRARLTGPNWTSELPWVLLGIRTAPKEDLGWSSAEMVYGAPLTVPGDFFVSHNSQPEHHSQLQQLRDQVRMQVPMPTSKHGVVPSSMPPNLKQSQFVFVSRDAHRTPFQRPYEGPFKVIQPGDKIFKVDIRGMTEIISVDRLKPAFIDLEHQVIISEPKNHGQPPSKHHPVVPTQPQKQTDIPKPVPLQCTRSGRTINVPQRYISVLGGVL